LSKYIEKRKYIVLALVIVCQVGLFLLLKLYFFEKFNTDANIFDQLAPGGTANTAAAAVNTTLAGNSTENVTAAAPTGGSLLY
jgi:hypothetical protein